MVYESDFYTTRRPYSRPTVTSYSVTPGSHPRLHGLGKAQTFHHAIPFIAHKRLTVVSPPSHSVRVRPSVILAEIDRINRKVRPSLAYQPEEDFLNSRSVVSFDDETRSIRAQTAALLKRIHEPLPRPTKIFPISVTRYQEPPIPQRITSDAYIHRLLGPTHNVRQEILSMSHYDEPAKRLMGKGHLACVSFAGGRAFPRRKNLYVDDDRVKNDVKYLSHYKKNRLAAENPTHAETAALYGDWFKNPAAYTSPPRSRPISRFYRPTFVPENTTSYQEPPPPSPVKKTTSSRTKSEPVVETPPSATRVDRQTSLKEEPAEDYEDTAARMNRRKKKKQEEAKLAEEKASEEKEQRQQEVARQAELARQEKLAQEAALERQAELERKADLARQEELAKHAAEEAELKAEAERLEAERKAEAERQAELERQEAERKAEAERQAELERQAEEERQAELARQEAEKKAEEEKLAELERQEAERKAEEEKLAELERQEAELKAEEERLEAERVEAERKAEQERLEEESKAAEEALQAESKAEEEQVDEERKAEEDRLEAERIAEEERKAEEEREAEIMRLEEEELAKLEAEALEMLGGGPTSDNTYDTPSAYPETEAVPAEEEVAPAEDKSTEVTSPADESGPEPFVEEPLSPEANQEPTKNSNIEEVQDVGIAEEDEE